MYFSLDGSSWKACLKSALWALVGAGTALFLIWAVFSIFTK
jgi:hypothetical protein